MAFGLCHSSIKERSLPEVRTYVGRSRWTWVVPNCGGAFKKMRRLPQSFGRTHRESLLGVEARQRRSEQGMECIRRGTERMGNVGHVRGAFSLCPTFRLEGGWVPLGMSIWSGTGKAAYSIDADSSTLCAIGRENWSCALPIKSMPRHDEFDWTGTREVRVTLPDDTDLSLHNFAWEVYRGHPGKVERWLQRRQP